VVVGIRQKSVFRWRDVSKEQVQRKACPSTCYILPFISKNWPAFVPSTRVHVTVQQFFIMFKDGASGLCEP
jgi:hypothetical protein